MEPRRRRRGNDVAGGVSAVVVQPSMEPRRRRRGNRARWWRARRTPRAFNGATASPPWKRSGWRLPRAALVPFNGATASPPWKHGVPLMELVQRSLPFNGATASPPWKPRTRDRTRCTLTPSMEPRRRRRGNLPCNSPVRCATCCLQWSHGVAAVETLRGELAHEPLELPSMEPRRRRRGNVQPGGGTRRAHYPSMEPRRRRRGNSATRGMTSSRCDAFNGATASPPWKPLDVGLDSEHVVALQWSHGVAAVETRSTPSAPGPAPASFNGATASPPWKLEDDSKSWYSSRFLQWSHGVAAVETTGGERTP